MTVTIIRGDARTLALADNSVDLIVTSPPYFGLTEPAKAWRENREPRWFRDIGYALRAVVVATHDGGEVS